MKWFEIKSFFWWICLFKPKKSKIQQTELEKIGLKDFGEKKATKIFRVANWIFLLKTHSYKTKCQIDTFHEVLPGNLVFFSFLLYWHNRTWIFGPDHWIALEKLHKYWKFHVRYLKIVLNIPWSNCAWNEYLMFQISNFSLAIFFWLDQINSSSRIINIIVITKFSKSDVSTYLRDDSFLKMQKHLPKSSQSSGKDKPVLGTMISLLSLSFLYFIMAWNSLRIWIGKLWIQTTPHISEIGRAG